MKSYNLRGFSFREFINLMTGLNLPIYSLEDILHNHEQIEKTILSQVSPMKFFPDYIHHGFYPFFLEHRNYSENLLKTMNMMTEVDILLIKQIDLKYLTKIKKLFYLLAMEGPKTPNISNLANEIETSRATVMNYIKYLADARLINIIYPPGGMFPQKPAKVMIYNTNLMHAIYPIKAEMQDLMETFFVNSLWKSHTVSQSSKEQIYHIDDKLRFRVCDATSDSRIRYKSNIFYARYNTEIGKENQIPLWLFGFLY